jgi:hypothetical protein
MITFSGPLKTWTIENARVHFMSVPEDLAGEVRLHAMETPRGFGSVKVQVNIDDVIWQTSVFPSKDSGSYFLPVKVAVCRKLGLAPGDDVTVSLELL